MFPSLPANYLFVSEAFDVISTKAQYLDASEPEIAKLTAGFSTSAWIKYRNLDPDLLQKDLSIILNSDSNFYGGRPPHPHVIPS